jgi:hypothetical protein
MLIGEVIDVDMSKVPEKGTGYVAKYPINDLTPGQGFLVMVDDEDKGVTLDDLKKKLVSATNQRSKKSGKAADGKAVKQYRVWVDTEEGGVMVVCTRDLSIPVVSTFPEPVPVPKKSGKKVITDLRQ